MPTKDFDVAIVGGGPAGCSTALRLTRLGFRCLVVEKSDYSDVRVGETLPAAIRKPLVDLGVWESFLAAGYAPAFALRSSWGSNQIRERDTIFDPHGAGWHIDRGHFDRMFAELMEAGGARTMRGARVHSLSATSDGRWRLEINCSGSLHEARSRILVDASGRRSTLTRRLGAKRITLDRLIGCVAFFHFTPPETVEPPVMLLEAAAGGWWYSALLPDKRMVAAYMTDADLFARLEGPLKFRFEKMIDGAPQTAKRLDHADLSLGPRVFAASSSRLDRVFGDNWIAVGDSAMAFDPLSSQGVYWAVKTGLRAADAIAECYSSNGDALAEYAAEVSLEFDKYLRQRRHYYSMEQRWRTKDFWRRRQVERHYGEVAGSSRSNV